MKSSMLK